jgi:acetyl-CoA acetyltransferase
MECVRYCGTNDCGASHCPEPIVRHWARAVQTLENPNFAVRLADYAGAPVNRAVQLLPRRASAGLSKAVEAAILVAEIASRFGVVVSWARSAAPPSTHQSRRDISPSAGWSGRFELTVQDPKPEANDPADFIEHARRIRPQKPRQSAKCLSGEFLNRMNRL